MTWKILEQVWTILEDVTFSITTEYFFKINLGVSFGPDHPDFEIKVKKQNIFGTIAKGPAMMNTWDCTF